MQGSSEFILSRKQRFSIAAAMCWAVLYLCGSPWMNSDWIGKDEGKHEQLIYRDSDRSILIAPPMQSYHSLISTNQPLYFQVHLPVEKNESAVSIADYPSLSYRFPQEIDPSPNQSRRKTQSFHTGQIRNRTLFSLGLLLIELCLNRKFEDLRREYQLNNFGVSMGLDAQAVIPDDMEIADRQVDRVYLDAGYSYGYAVQRCLRCEFPGRDITKNFDFKEFRRHFFNGVVAPVQAAFERQPSPRFGL
jgi:hypothetical protein